MIVTLPAVHIGAAVLIQLRFRSLSHILPVAAHNANVVTADAGSVEGHRLLNLQLCIVLNEHVVARSRTDVGDVPATLQLFHQSAHVLGIVAKDTHLLITSLPHPYPGRILVVVLVEADGLRVGDVLGVVQTVRLPHRSHVVLRDGPAHRARISLREGVITVERVCVGVICIALRFTVG